VPPKRRIRILLCGHENPLGCPNHGDIAREIWRASIDAWRDGTAPTFVMAEVDTEPIGFALTEKAHVMLRKLARESDIVSRP